MKHSRKYLMLAAFSYLLLVAPLFTAQAQEMQSAKEVTQSEQAQRGRRGGMNRQNLAEMVEKSIDSKLLAEIKEGAAILKNEIKALREEEETERKKLHKFLSDEKFDKAAYLAAHEKAQKLRAEMGEKRAAFIAKYAPQLNPMQRVVLPRMIQDGPKGRMGRRGGGPLMQKQ